VLVVLALITAVVSMRWSSLHHNAVAESAVKRLQFIDQHLRQFARSRGAVCELVVELSNHRVRKQYGGASEDSSGWESLGTGVRVAGIRVGSDTPTNSEVALQFDATGQSPTYGLHLNGPGKREAWLVFAGVSGQMTRLDTETAWNATFELLAPRSL